jgi:hypothetical protein
VKRVRFDRDAGAEFIAAGKFYEAQAVGLGLEFVAEAINRGMNLTLEESTLLGAE